MLLQYLSVTMTEIRHCKSHFKFTFFTEINVIVKLLLNFIVVVVVIITFSKRKRSPKILWENYFKHGQKGSQIKDVHTSDSLLSNLRVPS
jgi:hypothetical protein